MCAWVTSKETKPLSLIALLHRDFRRMLFVTGTRAGFSCSSKNRKRRAVLPRRPGAYRYAIEIGARARANRIRDFYWEGT